MQSRDSENKISSSEYLRADINLILKKIEKNMSTRSLTGGTLHMFPSIETKLNIKDHDGILLECF